MKVFGEKPSTIMLSAILAVMIATVLFLVWQKYTRPTAIGDYEGRVVDRWADYAEGDQGSKPRFQLAVETSEGKRITVRVDPTVYESARVGMRVQSKSGQIVLIEPSQSTSGSK
jgi:hypothetical protein